MKVIKRGKTRGEEETRRKKKKRKEKRKEQKRVEQKRIEKRQREGDREKRDKAIGLFGVHWGCEKTRARQKEWGTSVFWN